MRAVVAARRAAGARDRLRELPPLRPDADLAALARAMRESS